MTTVLFFIINLFSMFILFKSCNGQGMIALTKNDESSSEILSKEQLESLYGVAKNISHSKGSVIKSKEGEYEYRRSFTSKVEFEVNSLQLQNTVLSIKKCVSEANFNKSSLIEDLYVLESLVRQYDIGRKFVDLSGFNLILSLTLNEDDSVSNAAFLVLSAALQGNLDVQKHALTADLMKYIYLALYPPVISRVNSALLTLSAFVRNCPEALEVFLFSKGIYILSFLLENINVTKTQLRIIDILSDISVEILNEYPDPPVKLRKTFVSNVQFHLICDKIVNKLTVSEEYITHEKLVAALTSMFEICKDTYKKKYFSQKLKILMAHYNPNKSMKEWYAETMDLELKYYMFESLKTLFDKLHNYEINIENSNVNISKDEL